MRRDPIKVLDEFAAEAYADALRYLRQGVDPTMASFTSSGLVRGRAWRVEDAVRRDAIARARKTWEREVAAMSAAIKDGEVLS